MNYSEQSNNIISGRETDIYKINTNINLMMYVPLLYYLWLMCARRIRTNFHGITGRAKIKFDIRGGFTHSSSRMKPSRLLSRWVVSSRHTQILHLFMLHLKKLKNVITQQFRIVTSFRKCFSLRKTLRYVCAFYWFVSVFFVHCFGNWRKYWLFEKLLG